MEQIAFLFYLIKEGETKWKRIKLKKDGLDIDNDNLSSDRKNDV